MPWREGLRACAAASNVTCTDVAAGAGTCAVHHNAAGHCTARGGTPYAASHSDPHQGDHAHRRCHRPDPQPGPAPPPVGSSPLERFPAPGRPRAVPGTRPPSERFRAPGRLERFPGTRPPWAQARRPHERGGPCGHDSRPGYRVCGQVFRQGSWRAGSGPASGGSRRSCGPIVVCASSWSVYVNPHAAE